ncbi:APC family permease [Flavisolibacter nicotianae]|uniref:APC family permease n=1 Tax=Flavisolibacter nicotianae TaxID=2364882 RepID=UPI000EAC31E0|nr:APC family permease [Flavisolibacter nicotianae]
MMQKQKLQLFDLTMIVISFVIGMGIFRTPVNVAAASPTPAIFYLCWVAGGLVALCGALTYAEIGSRLPVTGGYYKVFAYAYHPSIAFAINCIILVSNAASCAAVALVGSEYISSVLIPASKDAAYLQVAANAGFIKTVQVSIAVFAITLFYIVNMLGLRMSAKTQTVLMIIKIGMVVLLITPLFFATGPASSALPAATGMGPALREYIKAFGVGLVAVSFSFGGYQQTINFGEEVEKPNRNIPRGIFIGIFVIILLYLLINYAYVKVIGFEELKKSTNIAAIMASKIFGAQAERILSVLLFLGVLAYVNAVLLSNPRVMYAMSEDGILPAAFTRRNKKEALSLALTVFAAVAAIVVFWAREFDKILSFTIFLDSFGMALSAGSIFIIRKRTRHLDGSGIFSMKLYPLLPLVFIAAYIFVAISIALDYRNNDYAALIGLLVLAFFTGLYFLVKTFRKPEQVN